MQSNTVVTDASDLGIYVPRPPPEVRLVIFKELGDCDRPILFDSKCFKKNSVKACEKVYNNSLTRRIYLIENLIAKYISVIKNFGLFSGTCDDIRIPKSFFKTLTLVFCEKKILLFFVVYIYYYYLFSKNLIENIFAVHLCTISY